MVPSHTLWCFDIIIKKGRYFIMMKTFTRLLSLKLQNLWDQFWILILKYGFKGGLTSLEGFSGFRMKTRMR